VQVALWEESDRDNLHTRLDEEWDYSAFEIEAEKEINGQVRYFPNEPREHCLNATKQSLSV